MNQNVRIAGLLLLPMMMLACTSEQSQGEAEVAQENMNPPPTAEPLEPVPPANAPATSSAAVATSGSMVVYTCDDGSGLTVTYDKYGALVKLPTGSTMLSRAESASSSYDEAYMGEELSLYRTGGVVQLQVTGRARNCTRIPVG